MSDYEAIQGLWRYVSRIYRGQPSHSLVTHYLFSGDRHKEIVPTMVDEGKVRTFFELDEEAHPKEIVMTMDWNGPDGPLSPNPLVMRGFYRLSGDDLQMCFGIANEFPRMFSDEYGLLTLKREFGPVPECRKPSGTPPIQDDVIGTLQWDDNLSWYSAKISYNDYDIDINLSQDDTGFKSMPLVRARHVIRNLEKYVQLAKKLASEKLLDLANDWNEDAGTPITASEFERRIRLEGVVFALDGGVIFYHKDDGIFWGHCVQLGIDQNDNYVHAAIPG